MQFPTEVLEWIAEKNLWSLWVPKSHGGLELSFTAGLRELKSLAKIDGSLGWTITLCSGANFFIGNLQPEAATEIFGAPVAPVCFGGSGGVFGIAEKLGNTYKISGQWHYATGASYLTHFTLNAKIIENGEELQNKDGSPVVRSFVLPKDKVEIVENWNTMGLKASVTHSFDVKEVVIDKKYSFLYNQVYLDSPIFNIPFSVFADLTLWVNYIGMAEHFLEEAAKLIAKERLIGLETVLDSANEKVKGYALEIEKRLGEEEVCSEDTIERIHSEAVESVQNISKAIMEPYPWLGVSACREDHQLNQVFRDYFTATQHHIFTKRRS
ncbi:acyl-CoA dehydrogenase [Arenibacter sp. 6A1]|nr:acyl-CoA dehydrogenase [Arenibacter sp. 6A1]